MMARVQSGRMGSTIPRSSCMPSSDLILGNIEVIDVKQDKDAGHGGLPGRFQAC
jgi:hypothetical protein